MIPACKALFTSYTPIAVPIIGRAFATDFNPALEFCNENHRDANLFIYFTDGYASVPSVKLSNRTKLLWLLFKNGSKEVDEMINYGGKCIKMNF